MPASRKGMNFKEFASTLRQPPLQFENPGGDPLQTPAAKFLQQFAVGTISSIMQDLKDSDLEIEQNKYNKQPFKNYTQKVKEDEELKNPVNKLAKAALVNKANLNGGDPLASSIAAIIDSFTDNITLDSIAGLGQIPPTPLKKQASKMAREEFLKSLGLNSLALMTSIGVSSLVSLIPIETITQFNTQEYLKFLDPVFLLEKLIGSIKNKRFQDAVNDFKLVGRFVNSVLTSSQFESKMQQVFLDMLADQEDLPEQLRNITSFDQVTALVNPDTFDANPPNTETFVNLSTVSLDLLQNGQLGIDLEIVSRDVNGNVLGEVSLNSLSEDLTGLVSGAQDDLQSLFDSLESCSLPDPDMFNKYRKLGLATKQFFKGFKPFKKPKKPKKPKLPVIDRHKLLEEIPAIAAAAMFYTATSLLFKAVLSALEKLIPDLSCASISAMIPDASEIFGPRDQNTPMTPEQLAQIIAENIRSKNPSAINDADTEAISEMLAEIATSIGLVNGVDVNTLNQFMALTMSVLTQREYCELLTGSPTGEAILIVQNIIDYRFPQAGISRSPEDIIKFFSSLSTFLDPGCGRILTTVDIPVNTVFCEVPEYYQLYNDLRVKLLKEKGLQDRDIEVQINKVCDINARQAQQFLDLLNNENPLDSMIPTIETGNKNCGPDNSIGILNELVSKELTRSYGNMFRPLKEVLDDSMVGNRGFLTSILASKNGLAYPIFDNLVSSFSEAIDKNELLESINDVPDDEKTNNEIFTKMKPKTIASWMTLNLEEFCTLPHTGRLASTPLSVMPGSFNNPDSIISEADNTDQTASEYRLTEEDKIRLIYLSNLTEDNVSTIPADQLLNYDDLFKRMGNIKFGVRALSYSGFYDPTESVIGDLSVSGIRQINIASGASTADEDKKKITSKMLSTLTTALVAPTLLPTVLAENAIAISDLKKSESKNIITIPQTEKKISSDQTGYRVKSYNFFILPTNARNQPVGTIKTQIFDYFPVNINPYQKISPLKKRNGDYIREKYESEEKNDIESDNQGVFDSNRKFYEIKTLTKTSKDYLIDLNEENVSTPTLSLALNDDDLQGSTQSLVFAEMVLKAMKDNLGIESDSIPEIRKYTDYLKKELYNYTFNSFLDGIMKIPAYNTKNLSFGLTEEKVNVLDLSHVNTITGDLDPVEDPTEYGGTFEDPSYYVYTKLNDDWKGLYNLYVRPKNDSVSPARTPIPDFDALTAESADLYQKFAEEYRTATDYSNQAPFDLIVQKASLVSMNGLLEMMMKVFVFEHYYKGFSLLNTVEITDNVFDNVYFEFLAKRFKEYAITAGPRIGVRRRKSKKFYHMLMEIYVMVLLKKKEARISSLTPTENDAINKIIRKSNIWKFGIPKNNLTDQEALYSRAYDLIAQHEVPGYPVGVVANAIGNSEGSLVAANGLIAQAKKQREEQIKIRNTYWSSIMEDCEPLFEQLLKVKFRQEMDNVSKQLSILNPNLIKENSILYMPINGGPIVQNYEVPPSRNDNTQKMRNIYDYHPSLLYSAGDILVTDYAYGPFYSFREEGNDRNFNGFFFSNLYNEQRYDTINVAIKNEPKEPVYKLGAIDPISNADMRSFIVNSIGQDSSNLLFGGGGATHFNGWSATTINSIELNKRDIIVNKFLLNPSHTKTGIDEKFKDNFTVLQDSKDFVSLGSGGTQGGYDPRTTKRDISETIGTNTVSAGLNASLGGGESYFNSVKRYKVISTEDSKIYSLGSDGFMVGGFSASNMPLVLSQTPAPIMLEQYIWLSEIEDFFQGTQAERANYYLPGSGIDAISSLKDSLQFALYGVVLNNPTITRILPETYDSSSVSEPTLQGIFKGPVSLSTLIYWLGNQGFFDMADNLLDLPVKTFFQPGTFKYGVRMLLMQPDSNLSIEGGIHAYLDGLSLDEPLRTKFEKAFSKETGYSIPIFKEEEEINWTFRDLKTIFNTYNSQGERRNSWIDHSALTRPILVRLFSKMACSTEYKKMFDFCIPLRYFASLSAIYTTKAFTNSIGSAVDWSGVKRTPQKLFPNDERNVLLSFYQSVRKVFYYSYNSFDPSYDGEGDELTNNADAELDSQLKAARTPSSPGRDGLILIDQLNKGLPEANKIDPVVYQENEDLLSLANSMYYSVLVDDPTNACGSVKKSDSC